MDEDFVNLLDSPDLPPNNLLLSVFPSTEDLWKGLESVFDFSFSLSLETLVFSDWSDLEDELDFDWSLLLELDFDWSGVFEDELDFDWSLLDDDDDDDDEEDDDLDWSDFPVLVLDCSDFELPDFDWSDFEELDFEPDKLAARLARPLRGLAAPDPDTSLLEEELSLVSLLLKANRLAGSVFEGFTVGFSDFSGTITDEVLLFCGFVTIFFIVFSHLEQYHTNLGSFTSCSITGGR